MELNYNRDLLKSILNMMGDYDKECSHIRVDSVVVFNSKYYHKAEQKSILTDPKYSELSTANFDIHSQDQEIRDRFNAIKDQIIKNREP